jgi:hypothetical protein
MAEKNRGMDYFGRREQEEKDRKEREHNRAVMARKFQKVFSTPNGKEVFNEIMEMCMVFQSTMTGNSYTYYNEGRRSVGLDILMMREQGWEHEIMLRRQEHEKQLTPKTEEK